MAFTEAGQIIYKALVPTFRMLITIGLGFLITKRGLFTAQGARGVSMLTLNIGLPSLLFSSIVDAFTTQNIAAFGALAICAILYMVIGGALAFVCREIFYVPRDFQFGILVMGVCSNWGNLPNAIVQTMALNSPFNGAPDVSLGVAYNSVFMLLMNIAFFSLGLSKLCGLDFHPDRLGAPDRRTLAERWRQRYRALCAVSRRALSRKRKSQECKEKQSKPRLSDDDAEAEHGPASSPMSDFDDKHLGSPQSDDEEHHDEAGEEPAALKSRPRMPARFPTGEEITRKPSRAASISSMLESTKPIAGTLPQDVADPEMAWQPPSSPPTSPPLLPITSSISRKATPSQQHRPGREAWQPPSSPPASPPLLPATSSISRQQSLHQPPSPPTPSHQRQPLMLRFLKKAWEFQSPITISVAVALPCALIPPVKALFVAVDGYTGTIIPNAPDGNPPLGFLLQTASFIGGLTVPCTLILLGASFARLKVPADWHTLPLSSMFAMAAIKMILVPLVGVFLVQRLHSSTSLFPSDDKMRIFIGILSSGTPAAVNQLVVTQLYNPNGTAQTLSMFLLPQYVFMPIFSTGIAAIALYITIKSTS